MNGSLLVALCWLPMLRPVALLWSRDTETALDADEPSPDVPDGELGWDESERLGDDGTGDEDEHDEADEDDGPGDVWLFWDGV